MAHAARLSELGDGLVSSIIGRANAEADLKRLYDRVLKGLRTSSHARTNQFDVQAKLGGLVEKFAVLNRDDLAEGLQTRLDELPTESRWLPEILSLLLQLSDRPLEKTRLEDVEALSGTGYQEPALTWADIVADDPLDEPDIWDDVERGYHSSDDDFTADEEGSGDETRATSIGDDDPFILARMHVMKVDHSALDEVKEAHSHLAKLVDGGSTSELALIRETLAMLYGLPTNIYDGDVTTGHITPTKRPKLATVSTRVLEDALQGFADIGSSLNSLRIWIKSDQRAPTLRSCQAALQGQMAYLASALVEVEQRYLTPRQNTVASIIEVRSDVERLSRPLLLLAKTTQEDLPQTATTVLDALYDQMCLAQLSGDYEASRVVLPVLAEGLRTYLRPALSWVTEGQFKDRDHDFFVVDADSKCGLGSLWHDRYALWKGAKDEIVAPAFMKPFVDRIFALGKGRAFLNALSSDDHHNKDNVLASPPLDFHTGYSDLLPFSQVLADSIEQWIADQSQDQTPLLRQSILYDHGLLKLVNNLQHIFFSQNGRRFQTFADTLFWRLDHATGWNDAFLLSELAQATLGSADGIASASLSVQIGDTDAERSTSIRRLESVRLRYHVPWPVQNVTASELSSTHANAFTLLLQTYRAKSLLRSGLFDFRAPDAAVAHPKRSLHVQTFLRLHFLLTVVVDIFHVHVTRTTELVSRSLELALVAAEDMDAMTAVWRAHERQLEMGLLVAQKLGPVRQAVVHVLELPERLVGLSREWGEGPTEDRERKDLDAMRDEVDQSVTFIIAGLRGLGRAGGNATLEALAERLEWAFHYDGATGSERQRR